MLSSMMSLIKHYWKHLGIITPFVYYWRDILVILVSAFMILDRNYDRITLPFQNTQNEFDFIIVGSGSAGSVLATRLSEHHSVLLLEAGGSPTILQYMPILTYVLLNIKSIDWAQRTVPQKYAGFGTKNNVTHWPAGKTLGGSTALNGMIYIRGNVQGFDEIAEKTQDDKWKMYNMLNYFKRIENYHGEYTDGSSEVHGKDGYLHVEKITPLVPLVYNFLEAGAEMGYKIRDPNAMGPHTEGFSVMELMKKSGMRYNTYDSLLWPIRNRPNLVIRKYSHVTKVLFKGKEAYGVEYERHGVPHVAKASREVILSAGSLSSPKILMLSGIGPKKHLEELGIDLILDLPVGERLQDKYGAFVGPFSVDEGKSFLRTRDLWLPDLAEWLIFGTGLFSSTRTDATAAIITNSSRSLGQSTTPDIHFYLATYSVDNRNKFDLDSFMNANEKHLEFMERHFEIDGYAVLTTLAKPYGFGTYKLRDKNPYSHALIDPEYLKDDRDMAALLEAMKFAIRLTEAPALKKINARFTREIYPGCEKHEWGSDNYYECFIRHNIATAYKPCGTVPLGKGPEDPYAVVDSSLRVLGTQRLRVIDGSVLQSKHMSVNDIVIRSMSEMMSENILEYWRNKDLELASDKIKTRTKQSRVLEYLVDNNGTASNDTSFPDTFADVCEWKDYISLCKHYLRF